MAEICVGPLASVPPGSLVEVKAGGRTYVVCNSGGTLHALDGICPHQNGPLAHGALHGKRIVCPWHAWEFDCETGEHDYNPAIRLEKAEVLVRGEVIYLIPGAGGEQNAGASVA